MKKLLVFILVLTELLTLGSSIANAELATKSDGYHLVVQIKKGWNLMPVFVSGSLLGDAYRSLPGIPHDNIKAIYMLDPENKRYISSTNSYNGNGFSDEQKKFLDRANPDASKDLYSNFLLSAVWTYSTQDGTIEEGPVSKDSEFFNIFSIFDNNPKYPQFNGVTLYKGWNFFSITPDLLDIVGLQSIQGNCQITKVALWEAWNQSWKKANEEEFAHIMQKEPFNASDIGEVIALKVAQDCKLSSSGNAGTIGNPPAIPN